MVAGRSQITTPAKRKTLVEKSGFGHRIGATAAYSTDQAIGCYCDVTQAESLQNAVQKACLQFGGLDIVVHSAGLAISKPLLDTTEADWNLLQDVLVKGQFLLSKTAAEIMNKQGLGGNIVNIASKNGLVSGPNGIWSSSFG